MSNKTYNANPLSGDSPTYEELKYTRDFERYLDMLNALKNDHLIILCLKNTSGQNFSEEVVEKIHSLGFSGFTPEPDMKYVGISGNGSIICDNASKADKPPVFFKVSVLNTELYISFEEKKAEIYIDGEDQALNDIGVNIAVYDLKNRKIADVSCYSAAEGASTFYHRNFYFDKQYIDTHIYVSERYKESVTLPLRRSYFSNRRLNVKEVEKGIFLPTKDKYEFDEYGKRKQTYKAYGGVCDECFNFIAGHQVLSTKNTTLDDRHISGSYEVSPEKIIYMDETVLYGGSLIEHPGHLIIESFADRLWWLVENSDSNIKIAIEIIWSDGEVGKRYNSFVTEILDAFGISKDRLIIIEKPTQFKKIIVPDQSAIPFDYCFPYDFTSGFMKPFQRITERITPGKHKKIYLTKSKLFKKSVVGEEYFIDFYIKKGFEIIHPEDYTMKEKAEIMYGADEVVTIDGTNSLFTLFCKPSVRITILTRRMNFWDTPQQLINEALGIKEFFLVNVSGNFLDNFSDNSLIIYARGLTFVYATKEFQNYVKYVYNEELDITPEESLKKQFYDYIAYFSKFYSNPLNFRCVKNMNMAHILRSMSVVFFDKELDTKDFDFQTDDELHIQGLERRLEEVKEAGTKKVKLLTEQVKDYIDEITGLKQSIAQLQAENQQLSREKAELTAYMAEISSLLDALEAGGGLPAGEK